MAGVSEQMTLISDRFDCKAVDPVVARNYNILPLLSFGRTSTARMSIVEATRRSGNYTRMVFVLLRGGCM